jgi:hypothetical protein
MSQFRQGPYRVIQWATGNQGRFALGMLTSPRRPHLELVGCWVHSEDKDGADAGVLAGLDPVGVAATRDAEALLALEADCIVYSGFYPDIDLFCRMLEAGKNVVTQVGPVFVRNEQKRARLEAACARGGTSFHAAGINTGFFSDRLCQMLTTLNGELEHVTCLEYSHDSVAGLSPSMVFEAMGFGWTAERLERERPPVFSDLHDSGIFAGGDYLAAALGFTIDRRESEHEFAMTTRDVPAAGGVVRAGTVGAVASRFRMYSGDTERLEFSQIWKVAGDVPTGWEGGDHPASFYQIRVEGTPSYKVRWRPHGDGMADALYATAATVVNAIPLVCDAPPGVRTQLDLPMITFTGGLDTVPTGAS